MLVRLNNMPKELSSPQQKHQFASLAAYIARRVGLREIPSLQLKDSAENAKEKFGYTGDYDRIHKRIRIFITGRHPSDILRTYAHEMIHHWQNERGVLAPSGSGTDNGTSEKPDTSYAQNDIRLRTCEYEAYLFGNIMFRDWQDENRHGAPPIQPPLPPLML